MEEHLLFYDYIKELITIMETSYTPSEWRLFIDSIKRNLECVLLHNVDKLAPISIGHSLQLINMKTLLYRIKYTKHEWVMYGDLKVLSMLLMPHEIILLLVLMG